MASQFIGYGQTPPGEVAQAPTQAPVQASAQSGLFHSLEGIGQLALGAVFLFGGGSGKDEDDDEAEEASSVRPRPRPRYTSPFAKKSSARAGKGSCCRAPTRAK